MRNLEAVTVTVPIDFRLSTLEFQGLESDSVLFLLFDIATVRANVELIATPTHIELVLPLEDELACLSLPRQ